MSESNDDCLVSFDEIVKELKRIAKDTRKEEWPDSEAQHWYVSGIRDSVHLLRLTWKE